MKILTTSDWHIGNMFHGIDRLPEHKHFFLWLEDVVKSEKPDALLVAGDIFDNGNPSAAAQEMYYDFLDDITHDNPLLQVIIIAGNHDSANRLEAPSALLRRHKVEVRGRVHRNWNSGEDGHWEFDLSDLLIPITSQTGDTTVVLAVPYLRSEVSEDGSYSKGVNSLLHNITDLARDKYPDAPLIMMAHMYAAGAEIRQDSSEKILIGGQEQIALGKWDNHPDYLTCGHIHKRQHIWGTDWARYTGSVLPMSFAERDYHHGVDMVTISNGDKPKVDFIEYTPQHPLMTIPDDADSLELKDMKKAIKKLPDSIDGRLDEHSIYLELRLRSEKIKPDDRKQIDDILADKNAVLCKLTQVMPNVDLTTTSDGAQLRSIDDILKRNPMDAVEECFIAKKGKELNDNQKQMVKDIIADAMDNINEEND